MEGNPVPEAFGVAEVRGRRLVQMELSRSFPISPRQQEVTMVGTQSARSRTPALPTITPEHVLQRLATLLRINDGRISDRAAVQLMQLDDSDDEVDTPFPVYQSYLNSETDSVLTMTNFGPAEFERLWTLARDHVAINWNTGRGKKCSYSGKDVLFMFLSVLKNCGKWDIVAAVFRVKAPSFQKMIAKFAAVLSPFLCERLVATAPERYPMKKLVLPGRAFENFPYARYASDVTFQPTNIPAGCMQERVLYYSRKHHLHGYKVEVHPNLSKRGEFHVQALRKAEEDDDIEDVGRLVSQYPTSWAVLADKGYQGLSRDFRAVTPYKRAPLESLTLEQVATNERIAHDRILVENYFGRLCTLWSICADKYRWEEDSYDTYFQACVSLTNFHIRANPLRREEGEDYARYLQRLREIGESIRAERNETQRRYRENRRNRINTLFAVHRERAVGCTRTPKGTHREASAGSARARRRARRRLEATPLPTPSADILSPSDDTDLSENPLAE